VRILALPLALSLLAITPTLRAETAAPSDTGCFGSDIAVPAMLPANVRSIPIAGGTVTTASLLAEDGTVVETSLVPDKVTGGSRLSIPKDLEPGVTYTIRWSDLCDGMRMRSFLAGAVAPMPTRAGLPILGAQSDFAFFGSCDFDGRPFGQLQRSVSLDPSPELVPFLAVSRVQLEVDGNPPTFALPGTSSTVGSVNHSCPTGPGTHFAHIRVHLPDGNTLMSDEFKIDFVCPVSPPFPCSTGEGDFDAGPPFGEDASAEVGANGANDPPRAGAYGCSASRSTGGQAGVAVVLSVLLAAASRRRLVRA
jgi:hypothetical protein